MKRIFGIVAIMIALALATTWYMHRAKTRAMNSGQVFVLTQPGEPARPLTPSVQPAPTQEIVSNAGVQGPGISSQQPVTALRTSDTISRNPPNGALFSGSGKYQLYRQGDITWRLDTETGEACILLATDAQWSKTRVFRHGCGAQSGS
jgi:hypothetical protein